MFQSGSGVVDQRTAVGIGGPEEAHAVACPCRLETGAASRLRRRAGRRRQSPDASVSVIDIR